MSFVKTFLLSILVYPAFVLIALLPYRILYLCSDLAYLIGYVIIKYRIVVVRKNLAIAFPQKSEQERKSIERQFYRNFFDIFFETIKLMTASEEMIRQHVIKGETGVLEKYYTSGQSIVLASAHFGNWEYGSVSYEIYYPGVLKGVYKPLTNNFFNKLMYRLRTRFRIELWTIEETLPKVRLNQHKHIALGLLSDQNPSSHKTKWLPFLGVNSPVYLGMEMIAKRFDMPVVYIAWERVGRGLYKINSELITDNPQLMEKYQITKRYLNLLERDINHQPDNWLWTHNRFKRVNIPE